jgi:hypothetical protein
VQQLSIYWVNLDIVKQVATSISIFQIIANSLAINQSNMRLILATCFSFILAFGKLYAQDLVVMQSQPFTARNSIFIEFLGSGFSYSLNYDRLITDNLSIRAGLSWLPLNFLFGNDYIDARTIQISSQSGYSVVENSRIFNVMSLPLTVSYLYNFQGTPSYLEFGGGPSFQVIHQAIDARVKNMASISTPPQRISFSHDAYNFRIGGIIGYRLQPQQGRFQFRASLTPFLSLFSNEVFSSQFENEPVKSEVLNQIGRSRWSSLFNFSAGISLGYSF